MARDAKSHQRKQAEREAFARVLIVPEGTKTEPYYLHRLKYVYGLSMVEIMHSGSTDPQKIVDFALARISESDEWNRVYCVFDGDVERNLAPALGKLRNSDPAKRGQLHSVLSVPCIEFWFLLHFTYTSKAYTRMAERSPCDAVQTDLKKFLADYDKGDKRVFDKLHSRLDTALTHGARLLKEQSATGGTNPLTYMHEMVSYLVALKKSANA